jgi:hypothetical protein
MDYSRFQKLAVLSFMASVLGALIFVFTVRSQMMDEYLNTKHEATPTDC